jgi:flagellar M-ring protein FliF
MGPLRLAAILGITAGITIALILMSANMGQADKALLYADLQMKEAGQITTRLDQMNVKYDLRAGGTAIFVERDKVQTAKMTLAGDNLPSSTSAGYEIFDNMGSMGQTSFQQNIAKLRAMQGELERTITSLNGVEAARVMLVLPERKIFQSKVEKAKASVTLKLGANSLGSGQTNAIRHLVASAVPGLTTTGVTVIDDTGRVLAGGEEDGAEGGLNSMDRRASVEEALRQKIRKVLVPVVGVNGLEVEVSAQIDLNRITQHETILDPDSKVLISSDTTKNQTKDRGEPQNGAVTVGENIPGGKAASGSGTGSSSEVKGESKVQNYEYTTTEKTTIFQSGAIQRLSIAVNVDGISTTDVDGNVSWAPRSETEMAQIENLVKSAVGYDANRNDILQVTNLRFMTPTPLVVDPDAKSGGFTKNDIMRLIELGILAVVSIVMIFFLGRPLLQALLGGGSPLIGGASPMLAGAGAGAMPQLPGATMPGPDGQIALPAAGEGFGNDDPGLDVSKIEGQVKASSVKKVASIVDSHPEESVSILRTWLHEA